jgi:hypothetical protein
MENTSTTEAAPVVIIRAGTGQYYFILIKIGKKNIHGEGHKQHNDRTVLQ